MKLHYKTDQDYLNPLATIDVESFCWAIELLKVQMKKERYHKKTIEWLDLINIPWNHFIYDIISNKAIHFRIIDDK